MENLILVGTMAALALAVLLYMLSRLGGDPLGGWPESKGPFREADYGPMIRLLGEEDLEYLRQQQGYRPAMERRLRSARRVVFRGYLSSLERDFRSLHLAIRDLLLAAPEDQTALLKQLAAQNLRFRLGVYRVRFDLALHYLHLSRTPADLRGLIEATGQLNELMRTLGRPQAAAASA